MDDSLYISLEQVKAELLKRQGDIELKNSIKEYLGEIPAPFIDGQRAVLFRNIITPNLEFLHFIDQANAIGLSPLGVEHTRDKFSTRNADKMALAKLSLILGKGKDGNLIIQKKKIIDIKDADNKPFREILTLGYESLPHFHHCLLRNYFPEEMPELFDISDWLFEHAGTNAQEYYKKFLALFICHGVLFETFVTNDYEAEFTKKVVQPAFDFIHKKFGLKPLIVRSSDILKKPEFWMCYPDGVNLNTIL